MPLVSTSYKVAERIRCLKGAKKNPKINGWRDFPGGPVVKNPPSNAVDEGLIPGQGTKIPCVSEQLSL